MCSRPVLACGPTNVGTMTLGEDEPDARGRTGLHLTGRGPRPQPRRARHRRRAGRDRVARPAAHHLRAAGCGGRLGAQDRRDLRPRQRRHDPALRPRAPDRAADPAVPLPGVRQRPPRRDADRDRRRDCSTTMLPRPRSAARRSRRPGTRSASSSTSSTST